MHKDRPLLKPEIRKHAMSSRSLARLGDIKAPVPPEQLLGMGANENALGTAPAVAAAIQQAAATLSGYPSRRGELDLREKIAALHGQELSAENILIGNSGLEILETVAAGFLEAGEEIISFVPTFGFMLGSAKKLGAKVIELRLSAENDFFLDLDRIKAAITDKTRIIYLCNPNNPTGNIFHEHELAALMDAIPSNIVVLYDMVYHNFTDDETYPDTTPYIHAGRNLIQLFSFSKAHGLAGLRLGYAIMRPQLGEYLAKMQRPFHIGRLQLAAGMAAIDATDHVDNTAETIIRGRNWLLNQISELGIKVWPSQGNFILMDIGRDAAEVCNEMLQHGIIVADGKRRFGLPTCIRVTVGLPEHNQRFIEALAQVTKTNP